MQAHVSLLAIVALPMLAGLLICGFEAAWRRWFGAERALALAGRVALGGTLLAALLLAAGVYALRVRPDLGRTQAIPWAGAGYTTALDLDLELGGLALVAGAVALVTALGVQLAALGDVRAGARSLGRSALLLGGTLLLALSATLWGAALGWQIVVLVACSRGHVREDMSEGAASGSNTLPSARCTGVARWSTPCSRRTASTMSATWPTRPVQNWWRAGPMKSPCGAVRLLQTSPGPRPCPRPAATLSS